MIHSKDQKTVWVDKRELDHIISGLKNGMNVLEESCFIDYSISDKILLYVHKLKTRDLSTKLFYDINSVLCLIAFGLIETEKYFSENNLDGYDWFNDNVGIASSAQFMEEDSKYFCERSNYG